MDEVGRLALTMNEMLDRLEASAEGQRRFVADASHELRTPLTRMRTEIDVALAHPDCDHLEAVLRSVGEDVEDLERLVEGLLILARSDGDRTGARRRTVDLDDIVLREVARIRDTTGAPFDLSAVSAAQVLGDGAQLTIVVRNLLQNAVRHGGGTVTVEVGEHGTDAVLAVSDEGPGVPPDQQEEMFARFSRADASRTRSGGGVGLGLSIARAIVHAHGGIIAFDPSRRSGARVVVRLPLQAGNLVEGAPAPDGLAADRRF
jgi:signal transduction histidine kinase